MSTGDNFASESVRLSNSPIANAVLTGLIPGSANISIVSPSGNALTPSILSPRTVNKSPYSRTPRTSYTFGNQSPMNQPMESPMNQPMGSPMNQPMGSPMNQPMGSPMNQPMGSPMNQKMGSPM